MKQYEINRAFNALMCLAKVELPVRDAYDVYMLSKSIEPLYMFELEQEKKYLEKYNGSIDKKGELRFKNQDDAAAFRLAVDELNMLDVEFTQTPIVIQLNSMTGGRMSASDIAALDGFVTFE